MKHLLIAAIFIGQQLALACEPSSPEMSRYLNQKTWKTYQLRDDSRVGPVNGYIDPKGNFYFDDMSRGGIFEAQLTVDPNNKSYRDFFAACRNPEKKGYILRSMRRDGENNRYIVSVRYLPKFSNLPNNPVNDQKLHVTNASLSLKFDPASLLRSQDSYFNFGSSPVAEVTRVLRAQLNDQSEVGVFTFDLTGWDDVVCDLVQGHAALEIKTTAMSNAPLVEQKRQVEPQDITTLAQALPTDQTMTKEQAIYYAARTQARLENDHRIQDYGDKVGFKLIQSLMDSTMSRFVSLSPDDLLCASDRLQSYAQNGVSQIFDVQVKLPSMDELNP
jgi:hypothetical protein